MRIVSTLQFIAWEQMQLAATQILFQKFYSIRWDNALWVVVRNLTSINDERNSNVWYLSREFGKLDQTSSDSSSSKLQPSSAWLCVQLRPAKLLFATQRSFGLWCLSVRYTRCKVFTSNVFNNKDTNPFIPRSVGGSICNIA